MTRYTNISYIFSAPDQRSLAENSENNESDELAVKESEGWQTFCRRPEGCEEVDIKIRKWLDHSSPNPDENVNV